MRRANRPGLLLLAALGALAGAACGGRGASGPHWPKSAGAITPDDPADDGGESLEPHRIGEQAAAVEHGGDDGVTSILDEPEPGRPPAVGAGGSGGEPPPATVEVVPGGVPVFEEIIIVN